MPMLRLAAFAILSSMLPISPSQGQSNSEDFAAFMPKESDRTSIWWRDGFPEIVKDADWRRMLNTGHYWFVFDTDSVGVARIGSTKTPISEIPGADLSLKIEVDGKSYHCKKGGEWSRFTGPRLIESGRFLQRHDVTDLEFFADDGTQLNTEARFEYAAWPDRLGLSLSARPGYTPFVQGEKSFGRVNGGFGLENNNRLDIPAAQNPTPENFTLCFWTYVPVDFKIGPHTPWLVSKNLNELGDGGYGITVHDEGHLDVRFNLGGGKENQLSFRAERSHALRINQWNHLAISYDGDVLRLYVNGNIAVEEKVGKPRKAPPGGLAFGGRQDGSPNYGFRGVVDEIFLFDKALATPQIRGFLHHPEKDLSYLNPVGSWTFDKAGAVSLTRPRMPWKNGKLEISLTQGEVKKSTTLPLKAPTDWQSAALLINPENLNAPLPNSPITVTAETVGIKDSRPVTFEPYPGWHRINLDKIEPIAPAGQSNPTNDALERIKLTLSNPTDQEQVARLMFEKTAHGFRQRIGGPITGITAMLRDSEGNPTGIPVQLSKNWHVHPEGGAHSGQWFHGISLLRLPPKQNLELELTIAYGHWGGVAAASHAQLSLIGWGNNQLWDQSALGSWGESICYEPEQAQANSTVTDVRPLMVTSMNANSEKWNWTKNVGGADWFRLFDVQQERIPHSRVRADYRKTGPCLTEVQYLGGIGKGYQFDQSSTVSLARRDDLVVGTYRLRLRVSEAVDFSRFVIFQIGSDTYAMTQEKKLAVGNRSGLVKEWDAKWGDNVYRGESIEGSGEMMWASLHESLGNPHEDKPGAWANRGFVIREWKAQLGGKPAKPWIAEHGLEVNAHKKTSTLDIVPPPGVTRLEPGDFVEATIEHVIMPQFAKDYYGPNTALREALTKHENTWQMIHRHAVGDTLNVQTKTGTLTQLYSGVWISAAGDKAEFDLEGGLGHTSVTIGNLSTFKGLELSIDGKPLNQSLHGNDFWQSDFDSKTGRWSLTFNVPEAAQPGKRTIRLQPKSK